MILPKLTDADEKALLAVQFIVGFVLAVVIPIWTALSRFEGIPIDSSDPIAGVLIGSGIALISTLAVNALSARQARRDRHLGIAYSILHKVLRLADTVSKLKWHIEDSLGDQASTLVWPQIPPLLGQPQTQIEFTADELALFGFYRQASYVNKLGQLASAHNILVSLLLEFNQRRDFLDAALVHGGYVKSIAGRKASVDIGNALNDVALAPEIHKLTDIAKSMARTSTNGLANAEQIVTELPVILQTMLEDDRLTVGLEPLKRPKIN